MPGTNANYQNLDEKVEKEKNKLKKDVASIASMAVKEDLISTTDYQRLTSNDPASEMNDLEYIKELFPKLKNRVEKRKNFLNDCKKKLKSLPEDIESDLSSMEQLKESVKSNSIFGKSTFLRDLTVKFNENFKTAALIKNLLDDFLKKNKDSIETNSSTNICYNLCTKKGYKKWITPSVVKVPVLHTSPLCRDPKKASSFISQWDISLGKLNKFYEYLKSSKYLPYMIEDKLKTDLKKYAKDHNKPVEGSTLKAFEDYLHSANIPRKHDYDYIFRDNLEKIISKLKNISDDFTYNEEIKPLIKTFKTDIENAFENLFNHGKEMIDNPKSPAN